MRKWLKIILTLSVLAGACYGAGRAYFAWTDGFSIQNIQSPKYFKEQWSVRNATKQEEEIAQSVLSQRFTYFSKGCQSYVFISNDQKYVLKFIKYQRFCTKPWLDALSFIPALDSYRAARMDYKLDKLRKLLVGWQTSYNDLPKETGVVWVHLNEGQGPSREIEIVDKLGRSHRIDLRDYQALLQVKADMLCNTLECLVNDNRIDQAKELVDHTLAMILGIYHKGYADNDHALMQNTGVLNGSPMPIDVGQLEKDPGASQPNIYKQALFNKTYRFKRWLAHLNNDLRQHLEARLIELIGEDYHTMKPHISLSSS